MNTPIPLDEIVPCGTKVRIGGERGPEFFGAGTFRGQPCVVMRRGETVPDGMGIREALRFVDDLADGLMAMKSNGYCHGDVKRINLCLFDGRAGILDLGSARRIVPDGSSEEATYTPGYAAPELTDGASAAPWFDVYGAAVTLNEILGQPALVVYSPAIRAGMDLRPGKRLPSAADFAAAMHDCYKEHRRQRTFSILVRVVTHSLVAALVVWICLTIAADRKERSIREVVSCMQLEIAALTELKNGKLAYFASNRVEAVRHFSNVVDFGKRAKKIIHLIEEAEKK